MSGSLAGSDTDRGHDATPMMPPGESGIDAERFKAAFRTHAAGVALVTADAGGGPVAMTVSSLFSASAIPPMLVFSASELSSSTPTLDAASTLVVHLLGVEHLDLAVLGATSGIDRFADTSRWSRLPTGEPYFPTVRTWVRGRIVDRIQAGTSRLYVVLGLETSDLTELAAGETDPLVYANRTWHALGEHSRVR